MSSVQAVLPDSGRVLYLPDHERVLGPLATLNIPTEQHRLDEAHDDGVAALDYRGDDNTVWRAYNRANARVCGVTRT